MVASHGFLKYQSRGFLRISPKVQIEQVELNLESRDWIIPVLRALQQVYCNRELTDRIL